MMPGSVADSVPKQSSETPSIMKVGDDEFQEKMSDAVNSALLNSVNGKITEESPLSDPPFMLVEALALYHDTRPPFVFKRSKKANAGTTKLVTVADNGKFPTNQRTTELIAGIWGDHDAYWTMEHGGLKLIVKAFSGAPGGGAAFRPWMGPQKGFTEPIAFSAFSGGSGSRFSRQDGIKMDTFSTEKDDDELGRVTARTAKAEVVERITNSFVSPIIDRREEIAVEMYATDDDTQSDSDGKLKESNMVELSFSHTPKLDSAIRRSSNNIAGHKNFKTRFSQIPNNGSSPHPVDLKRKIESPSSLEYPLAMLSRNKKSRRARSSRLADEQPGFTNNVHLPSPSSQILQSPTSPVLVLSENQLIHTILHVSLPPRLDFVPMRLRSCTTMDKFFDSILNAFDLQGNEKNLDAARVTFDWMPKNDKHRSWLVKRNVPDSFEMFLECVSAANVLVNEKIGIVSVEILLKE